ncbi:hypothetical protein EDB81DRAFT_670670 [Dactylonectria macrodidyma]|uniref:Uncharacterized protein n=1 Tax=Dactylonectria macrodidyma TaxID=307937 RepID=A0A9P9D4Q7_9HYPO|nr:hypothetical protein EDB81DRAFT_670670 [Dactylonectria macrodidyma]
MDPLSIAGSSATLKASCYELVGFTNSLIHDKVPDEDSTLAGLGWDLHFASQALDEINLNWRSNSSALMIHPSAGLCMWPNVQNTLNSAGITLQGLKKEIVPIMNSGRKGSFWSVGAKAWTMGRHIRAITNHRKRFQAHHIAFKVGANMTRMWVLSLQFRRINEYVSGFVC